MAKRLSIIGISVFFILGLFSLSFSDEQLTITTYYPSPYGSYQELTSYRMKIGTTYSGSSFTVNNNDLLIEGNVGIGTTNPQSKLDVSGTMRVGILGGATSPPTYLCQNTSGQIANCTGGPFPTIYTAQCSADGTNLFTCPAVCDAGDKVIGGGFSAAPGVARRSYPSADDRWLCELGMVVGTCYARCADVALPAH